MSLSRFWVAVCIVACCIPLFFVGPQKVGYSVTSENGVTHVEGGSSPSTFLFVAVVPFLFFNAPKPGVTLRDRPSFFRRFCCFWLDFFLIMFVLSPVIGMIPMALEYVRTGQFAWQFERDYLTTYDKVLAAPAVLSMMAMIFMYFAYPMMKGKQTPGEFLLGMRLEQLNEEQSGLKQASLRTFLSFIALCG
ncbi:MAG: hypothetical protein JWO13_2023 [Acidobacteriales bacterium]|nr:hypothetical protein [Terriglobales bacterium]